MDIEIIREKRKTIVLKLHSSDKAVLKVPASLSDKKIAAFLDEKRGWLEEKSEKMKQNELFSAQFDVVNECYLFGEKVDDFKNIIFGFEQLSKREKVVSVRKYYISQFANIENIAKKLSEATGLSYDKIKCVDSVRIWGSYSSTKLLKLNWKLVILPRDLVEYVAIHELCHSKHMNHKPQFWKEVEAFCPDYKNCRKRLNEYGFLLKNKV